MYIVTMEILKTITTFLQEGLSESPRQTMTKGLPYQMQYLPERHQQLHRAWQR